MDVVAALNLPAGIVQLPYEMFSANHQKLMPRGVDFKVWRAVTWPLVGMIFWWIAGRGADALMAARRKRISPLIGWVETTVGFLFLAGGVVMIVGIEFFSGSDRPDLQPVALISALWAFLGGLSVAGKIAQWRLRKRLGAEGST